MSYGYDGANRRTAVGYPSGHKASYAYSNLGQLATVTDWTGRPTTFSYDLASRLTTITRTNSVGGAITNSAYTYDNANRLTRIQHKRGATTLEDMQYTLNAAGLRTQMVDSIGTTTWAYDELNRLSSVSYPNSDAVVYGFDAMGNRTSMAENSVVTNYTYDAADRLTQSVKSGVSTSYTWDQNGNRLTKSVGGVTTSYGWDALDRMTSHAVGGVTTTYSYNGDSRRVSKSVGGSTTNFAWDVAGLGYILAESGASANEFVWGGGLIAQLTTSGGTPTYAHADGLGSLRVLTDVAGNVAGSKQYDAYGASRGTTGTTLSLGFTGEYQDSESGLIYLRARYYDPTTGRFVSQDPVPGQMRYGYAAQNPVSFADPSGLCVPACAAPALILLSPEAVAALVAAGTVVVAIVGTIIVGGVLAYVAESSPQIGYDAKKDYKPNLHGEDAQLYGKILHDLKRTYSRPGDVNFGDDFVREIERMIKDGKTYQQIMEKIQPKYTEPPADTRKRDARESEKKWRWDPRESYGDSDDPYGYYGDTASNVLPKPVGTGDREVDRILAAHILIENGNWWENGNPQFGNAVDPMR